MLPRLQSAEGRICGDQRVKPYYQRASTTSRVRNSAYLAIALYWLLQQGKTLQRPRLRPSQVPAKHAPQSFLRLPRVSPQVRLLSSIFVPQTPPLPFSLSAIRISYADNCARRAKPGKSLCYLGNQQGIKRKNQGSGRFQRMINTKTNYVDRVVVELLVKRVEQKCNAGSSKEKWAWKAKEG